MAVYNRLNAAHGPLHWWPGESAFEISIGAILAQNTAWRNVTATLRNLRSAGIWSIQAIHRTPLERLAETIRPSGYFNTKARKLKEFAAFITGQFGGDLDACLALPGHQLRPRLLTVWGIGEETADDVVLYAAGQPSFVIDAYTRRIVDRLGWRTSGNRYADYQALFHERLPHDAALFNQYHALLVRHGARTCRPKPLCERCPLLDICPTGPNPAEG
ncbi:MAG: hypothetical protein FJ313_03045 [Gemmatimonadetes bacterium]|nr:hypothetical protein [Gemmatimonadota bacterium]